MRFTEKATPLLVVGRQRSGTRFLTAALNQFPEVAVQGEIPNPVMGNLEEMIDRTEKYYCRRADEGGERQKREYRIWQRKKERLFFSLWAYMSQTAERPARKGCLYFGYKRPNNEFYFSFYERHLIRRSPYYIYCVRNFVDNYLSIKARWPERKIAEVAKDYLASIEQYRFMKQEAPDRVLLFVLDHYSDEGVDYLEAGILSHLGLDGRQEVLRAVRDMQPVNTSREIRAPRRRALTRREERFVARRPELKEAIPEILSI